MQQAQRQFAPMRQPSNGCRVQVRRTLSLIEGSCNICGVTAAESKTGRLVRDHNHTTNEIRGPLCDPCNGRLGSLESWQRKGSDWLPKKVKRWFAQYKEQIEKHLASLTGELCTR